MTWQRCYFTCLVFHVNNLVSFFFLLFVLILKSCNYHEYFVTMGLYFFPRTILSGSLYPVALILSVCSLDLFSSVQFSRSVVSDSATPWIAARQASLSITNSWSSPQLMFIKSVMPSSHLILCRLLLFLPAIPPSIRVFSNESALSMRWPKYWSFSFSISPSKEHPGLISFRMDWLVLLAVLGLVA